MEITIKHKFKLTPAELVKEFWDMNMDEQAEFFNQIAKLDSVYGKPVLSVTLGAIKISKRLTDEGREIMKKIGE